MVGSGFILGRCGAGSFGTTGPFLSNLESDFDLIPPAVVPEHPFIGQNPSQELASFIASLWNWQWSFLTPTIADDMNQTQRSRFLQGEMGFSAIDQDFPVQLDKSHDIH